MNAKDTVEISHEEIARLAYLKWESEGRPPGRTLQYWLDAERLLKTAKLTISTEAKAMKSQSKPPRLAGKFQKRLVHERKGLAE